jgi:hypothetical protein
MCAYQPYTLRERHPLFFRYPPNPLLSGLYLWPPDPQPVKPRPVLMESAPSRSSQQELHPTGRGKYTESTQQQPKPSSPNGNI